MKKIFIIIALFFCIPSFGQLPKDVDIAEFIRDMQQLKKDNNRLQLVWWIPDAYWDVSISQTNTVSPEIATLIKEALKDYVLVCVGDMVSNGIAGFKYKSSSEMQKGLLLKDSADKKYFPLTDAEISDDALHIREVLIPFLAKTLGQVGEGISIYFFKVKDKNGNNMINPYKKQQFSISLGDNTFAWKLPLPSLLAPRFCPVDNEQMKGNWGYCPIHGAKLKH